MPYCPHSPTNVCPITPDMPVLQHHPVSEPDQCVATASYDVQVHPATAKNTSHDSDAQFGGQYGAWSGGAGAGSGLSSPIPRGVSKPSVSHSTYNDDATRVPPNLLPDRISPLPGYGQSAICDT